jgi:hypothetical protein
MNARAPKVAKGQKAVRTHNVLRGRRCLRCPLCSPSGQCRDPALKSGRCGDWVWYMRGRKQHRHLYVKPRDSRTPLQLYWRACFGAASKKYSGALTDEQQDACIAAGAKLPCRKRLGESGCLTGQQCLIRQDYAAHEQSSATSAEKRQKGLQTKGILRSTSGTHRGTTVATPEPHRRDTGRAGKDEGRRQNEERRSQKERLGAEVAQFQRFRRFIPRHGRRGPGAFLWHAASIPGAFPASRGLRRRRGRRGGQRPTANNKSCPDLAI